jgi:L-gulonate 3-dehydrogenase
MFEADLRPIVLRKEIADFILNRLQYTLVAETLHLVGEGYCTPEDMDADLIDRLALRRASIGPFEVAHLIGPDGLQGFVNRLGPMLRRLAAEARTDHDRTSEKIAQAHAALLKRIPFCSIAERQAWRDQRIVALRNLKSSLPDPL